MKHYKRYLNMTHSLALLVFAGLIAWTVYFEDEFDEFREPYASGDFQARQTEAISITASEPEPVPDTDRDNDAEEDTDEPEPFPDIYGVSAIHPLAAEAGMAIMEKGGNAVDAAIAVSFMLNVVEPYGSGIGGGGLMLVHERFEGATTYDYREAAPVTGNENSPFAVPGLVKGMELAFKEQGSGNVSWEDLVKPAAETARKGFEVGNVLHQQISSFTRYVQFDTQANRSVYYPGGQPIPVNDMLVQEELADTLDIIKNEGAEGFYEGAVADAMRDAFGFSEEDLTSYEAEITDPAKAETEHYTIHGGPSPSSGTVVLQAFQMAERLDLARVLPDDELDDVLDMLEADGIEEEPSLGSLLSDDAFMHAYIHLLTEITDIAYQERLDNLGDPAFEQIDHGTFTSDETIDRLLETLYDRHTAEADPVHTAALYDAPGEVANSEHTTHFVILDSDGMMVSATNSLGQFFGSGRYSNGIFINSQMENFSGVDSSPNSFAPGKRPRSFVAPIIFEQEGQAVLGIGSPGGRRIPAMVLQTIMQYEFATENGEPLTLQEAIERPRFYTEDGVVHVEERLEESINQQLRDPNVFQGYTVIEHGSPLFYGGIQGLGVALTEDGDVENLFGGGDPRRRGVWQIDSGNQ
ncbi:gamma-glutamyltransferase family protein [Salisediminibacterium selenitireducens]|uniref:Gamma-glutamyltransferase n=1 Tax=Bacillus selenitireducens (strain ATCC 700615 / DSM 15326 / MLS10) TaxID=439292 RepID=D6XZK7_BACIE|nr:gamma-glutamyltransferase [Salisediminibacterium selenitireducens]ADH98381.1 Gamma-glutamyltransferase [[Bacillus] selenitireducens MLS10]